jgi:hypothetical protein
MTEILHLSTFLRRPIFDSDGDRIGRVQDLVARLGDDPHPPIVGAVIRIEGRDLFVPIRKIGGLSRGSHDLRGQARRPAPIRAPSRRAPYSPRTCSRATSSTWCAVASSSRTRSRSPRSTTSGKSSASTRASALPASRPRPEVGQHVKAESIVDFASIEPFVAHVPTARLRIPYRKLSKLHPAQIADLVEQASHEEGEEIIEAVGCRP